MKITVTSLAHEEYGKRTECTAPRPLLKRGINELNGLCEARKYFVPKHKTTRHQQEQPSANSQSDRVAAGECSNFARNRMQVWALFQTSRNIILHHLLEQRNWPGCSIIGRRRRFDSRA